METHPEYATAGTVMKIFLGKAFVVFMVGVLFSFVFLKSNLEPNHMALSHSLGAPLSSEATVNQFLRLDANVSATVTSRGPGEN